MSSQKKLGGTLSVKDLKGLLEASYKEAPSVGDYVLDKDISGKTAKVYHNTKNGKVVVSHRGTPATLRDAGDWLNNIVYALKGDEGYKKTKRFLDSKKVQDAAEAKYGTKKMATIGHSQGSKLAELLGKNGHEIITLNKATRPFSNVKTEHQYDIRSSGDVVSALNPFQKKSDKDITIQRTGFNPLAEHSIDVLNRLNPEQEIGREDEGGGFGSSIATAYQLFKKIVPVRKGFSNSDKVFLAKYGNWKITSMTVIRTPISSYIHKALSVLSVGEWDKAKARVGYDRLFHLALIGTLEAPPGVNATPIKFITERNDTVRVREFQANDIGRDTEQMVVPLVNPVSLTLNNIFDNVIRQVGDKLWEYDPFSNNCQDFLIQFLGVDHLLTPQVDDFIRQKVKTIAESLDKVNPYTTSIARGLIGISARLRALTGKGLTDGGTLTL